VGTVSEHVTPSQVTAEAATLRVRLHAGHGATTLDLGVLQVSAGSVEVPISPSPFRQGSLPLTGINAG
jgi:hypothetical protein